MRKKFWQRGKVSQIIRKKKADLKTTLFSPRLKGPGLEALRHHLPKHLVRLESGIEILDESFPIREGNSRVDFIASNKTGELIFIWARMVWDGEVLSRILPDYDWIQKNMDLWAHLFPSALQKSVLRLKVWCFGLEVDPEVKSILNYLSGIRIKLYRCKSLKKGGEWDWQIQPWDDSQKFFAPPVLPSAPPVLHAVPPLEEPVERKPFSRVPLTQEEINDLIQMAPGSEVWNEEEVTEPFFDPSSLKLEAN